MRHLPFVLALLLAAAPSAQIGWDADASDLRGRSGTVSVVCPEAGAADRNHPVWGSNPYTDDSSVCRAAVHAGAIDWAGGAVTLEARPGQPSYPGTARNGVTTLDYGSWGGSFAVVTVAADPTVGWDADAAAYRGTSARVTVVCPPARSAADRGHPVWGSGPYTDDSSVCRAAVHAGAITYADGGKVIFEPRPGQDGYAGSVRNGVETLDYRRWGGGFVIVR
ncbi:LCCL domain-containing protein [Rubrivirga sp. IMCC45206]|uniref:LCCL domain-containing protein n=1 Tax=Rubrivirga sp. IMCC45206 TaxID=3391614 RepID=UPI00398F9064